MIRQLPGGGLYAGVTGTMGDGREEAVLGELHSLYMDGIRQEARMRAASGPQRRRALDPGEVEAAFLTGLFRAELDAWGVQ